MTCKLHEIVHGHESRPLQRGGAKGDGSRCSLPARESNGGATVALTAKRIEDSRPRQPGFTLLEIILALAILAGSLAALGEVMRLADRNAAAARDETQAQIIAASIMDELAAGARVLTAITATPLEYETDTPWLYSVMFEQTAYKEMIAVRVLVEQDTDPRLQPARFQLVRWLPNPDFIPQNAGAQNATGPASGASSGGTGSQTGAGGQP